MTEQRPALRGMTWNHPRGIDPLIACSRVWRDRTGVDVRWDARSLQDFESYPVRSLAETYDLIVIDHPHVGQITHERCLLPLDVAARAAELEALRKHSVGASFESYRYEQRLWALPIDAATQVQAHRLTAPVTKWSEVLELAAAGHVQCPLRPPHNLMALYTLCGLAGQSPNVHGPDLFAAHTAQHAYELLRELASHLPGQCFGMDPIAVLDAMSQSESRIHCAPLIYGYVTYAPRIAFANIPVLENGARPAGSALGGTGIAVSAFSAHPAAAFDFAYWLASADCQQGPYARGGGQPGHAAAWDSDAVNEPAGGFYRNTRATLKHAWVRPRHDGYMRFQAAASDLLHEALRAGHPAGAALAGLNRLFRESFRSPQETA